MLGIFAKSFMTATRSGDLRDEGRFRRQPSEPHSWQDDPLPFRRFAGWRTGRDD